MNSKLSLLSITAVAALATSACVDDSVVAEQAGGYIQLSNMSYGASEYPGAAAAFYANVSTAGAPVAISVIPEIERDTCLDVEVPTPTPIATPDIEYLDVGGAVTLASGGTEISLLREDGGSTISYEPSDALTPDFDSAYDVTLGGGGSEITEQTWTAALRMPKKLTVDALTTGSVVIQNGGDYTLTWDSVDADAVLIRFTGQDVGKETTCLVADDGSFTIPQSVVDDLDVYGSVYVEAITEGTHSLDGRTVSIVGRTSRAASYEVTGEPPPPPPSTATNCEIVWMSASAATGSDVYAIDLEIASWTTGTKTFDTTASLGIFLKDYQSGGSSSASGRASSGTFSLEADGLADGAYVFFDDSAAQNYLNTSSTVIANGGTGYFEGELSPATGDPVLGAGTVSMTYNAATLTLGNDAAYAFCYDATEPAFVPTTPEARLKDVLARIAAMK